MHPAPIQPPQPEHRLWYDTAALRQEFLEALDALDIQLFTEPVRETVGAHLLEQIRSRESMVRSRLSTDFKLVVVGDFKRGKSTLINALLQLPVVTTNVTPETVTINQISYGPEVSLTAHLTDGRQLKLNPGDLAADTLTRIIDQVPFAGDTIDYAAVTPQLLLRILDEAFKINDLHELCFNIEVDHEHLNQSGTKRDFIRDLLDWGKRHNRVRPLIDAGIKINTHFGTLLRQALKERPQLASEAVWAQLRQKVRYLAIEAPVEWLKSLTLVDTPGNADLFYRFDEQVQQYLSSADAIIYLTSAIAPFSESERAFIQRSLPPQDFAKVFFVVNSMDTFKTEAEAQRIFAASKRRIEAVFPGAAIYAISALDECCRQHEEPQPHPARAAELERAFATFREALSSSIIINRDVMQLERAVIGAQQVVSDIEVGIQRILSTSQIDQERLNEITYQCENQTSELHRQIGQHQAAIRSGIMALSEEAAGWINGFINRLDSEAVASLDGLKSEDVQRHFYFFLADALSDALRRCMDHHRPQVIELLEQTRINIVADIKDTFAFGMADVRFDTPITTITADDSAWNNLDAIHSMESYGAVVMHLNFTFQLVAGFIAGLSSEMTNAKRIVAYQQKVREMLPDLRAGVLREVEALYLNMNEAISQQIERVYQEGIEHSLAAIRQAQVLKSSGSHQRQSATRVFEDLIRLLAQTQRQLGAIKLKLSSSETLEESWPDGGAYERAL